MLRGDLGNSWQTTRPVAEDLLQRFPATLELIILSLLLALASGIPLGRAGARLKKGVHADLQIITVCSQVLYQISG